MLPFNDSNQPTKEPSGDLQLDLFQSTPENFPGETMPPLFRASRQERIALFFRTPLGLAVLCISWVLLVLVLVFAFIPLTSWGTQLKDTAPSSTGASRWVSDSAGWRARKLLCSPYQPCDAYNPFSEDGVFLWRFEMEVLTEVSEC